MASGVFEIKNKVTGRTFISYSKDVDRAKRWNVNRLWRGLHANKDLQKDFLDSRGKNFEARTLILCKPSMLLKYRNQFRGMAESLYVCHTHTHHNRPTLTEEHRNNISFAMTGLKKKPLSQETKDKIAASLIRHFNGDRDIRLAKDGPIADTIKGVYDEKVLRSR